MCYDEEPGAAGAGGAGAAPNGTRCKSHARVNHTPGKEAKEEETRCDLIPDGTGNVALDLTDFGISF
jgi:hypothetical protein